MTADSFSDLSLDGVPQHSQLGRSTDSFDLDPSLGEAEHPFTEARAQSSQIVDWAGCTSGEPLPLLDGWSEDSPVHPS